MIYDILLTAISNPLFFFSLQAAVLCVLGNLSSDFQISTDGIESLAAANSKLKQILVSSALMARGANRLGWSLDLFDPEATPTCL